MILQSQSKKLNKKVKMNLMLILNINKHSNKGELENSNKKGKNRSRLQSVMKSLKSTLKCFKNPQEKFLPNVPFKDQSKQQQYVNK